MSAELNRLESMLKDEKIVIYGAAGMWASAFYTYLQLSGLATNLHCVTVTRISDSDKIRWGGYLSNSMMR